MKNTKFIESYEDLKTYNKFLQSKGLPQYEIARVSVNEDTLSLSNGEKYPLMPTLITFVTEPTFCFESVRKLAKIEMTLLCSLAFPKQFHKLLSALVNNSIMMGINEIDVGNMNCKVNPSGLTLIKYNGSASKEVVYLPSFITALGGRLFQYNNKLKRVISNAKTLEIGEYTFQSCINLESVDTISGIGKLGISCFSFCKSLKTVTLNSKLESITSGTFTKCKALKKIKLPKGLKSIEGAAFLDSGVEDVDFSECTQLKEIGLSAFQLCKNLRKVDLSNCKKLTEIGTSAFKDCSLLSYVDVSTSKIVNLTLSEVFTNAGLGVIKLPDTYDTYSFYLKRFIATVRGLELEILNYPKSAIFEIASDTYRSESVTSGLNTELINELGDISDEVKYKLQLAMFIIKMYRYTDTHSIREFIVNGMSFTEAKAIIKKYLNIKVK